MSRWSANLDRAESNNNNGAPYISYSKLLVRVKRPPARSLHPRRWPALYILALIRRLTLRTHLDIKLDVSKASALHRDSSADGKSPVIKTRASPVHQQSCQMSCHRPHATKGKRGTSILHLSPLHFEHLNDSALYIAHNGRVLHRAMGARERPKPRNHEKTPRKQPPPPPPCSHVACATPKIK